MGSRQTPEEIFFVSGAREAQEKDSILKKNTVCLREGSRDNGEEIMRGSLRGRMTAA